MAELHETKLKFDIGRWLPSIGREMSEAEFISRAVTAFAEMYESIDAFEADWEEFKNDIEGAITAAQGTANEAKTLAINTAVGLETTNAILAATDATVSSNTGRIQGAENELADVNENIEDLQTRVSDLEDRPSGWTSEQITLLENFKNSLNTLLDNMGYTGTNGDSVADACIATLTALIANLRGTTPTVYYTVSFNIGGHGVQPAAQNIIAGGLATNPGNLSESGWTFGGWYTDGSFSTQFDFATTQINANTTVYAKWTEVLPDTYTVSFDMGGHGTQISPITNVAAGSTISAPATPTASGWNFGGWYKESGLTNAWNFGTDTVTDNITLYAKWTAQPSYANTATGSNTQNPQSTIMPSANNYVALTPDVGTQFEHEPTKVVVSCTGGTLPTGNKLYAVTLERTGNTWTVASIKNGNNQSNLQPGGNATVTWGNNAYTAINISNVIATSTSSTEARSFSGNAQYSITVTK